MTSVSKLAITAIALVFVIAAFGRFIYTDVIWLSFALFGVLGMLALHLVEASERHQNALVSSIPRLLLGVSALIMSVFSFEPIYSALIDDNPRDLGVVAVLAMTLIAGLFLFVGTGWVRKGLAGKGRDNAPDRDSSRHH